MRKGILLLMAMALMISLNAQQQDKSATAKLENGNRAVTDVSCPENTVYSQTSLNFGGLTSWTGTIYKVYDQLLSDPGVPISAIVFYGGFSSGPDRNFTIEIHADNGGAPGALLDSYTAFIAGVNTGENMSGYDIYSYTYTFPASIPLAQGDWISVVADGSDYWYWWGATVGGDGCAYQEGFGGIRCDYGDMAFCLVGGAPTPLSPWAVAIGIALIATFVIIRTRRSV